MTRRPLLIVQTERLSASNPQLFARVGDMADMFRRAIGDLAVPLVVVNPAEDEMLPYHGELAGAIICGAAAMAGDADPWIDRLGNWLEQSVAAGLPVLGVCFGHQLLAHRLGGAVSANTTGPEYGTVDIDLLPEARSDRLLGELPDRIAVQAAHFETVSKLPEGAVALARGSSGIHAARFAPTCWGVQFHPEFSAGDAQQIAISVAERQSSLLAESLHGTASQVHDTPQAAALIRRFAENCICI